MNRQIGRHRRPCWMLGALVFLGLLSVDSVAQQPEQTSKTTSQAKLAPLVEESLWWLPEDTQTIIVDQIKAKLRDPDDKTEVSGLCGPSFLEEIRGGDLARKLAGTPTHLVLEGSRKFRPIQDIGMFRYEGATLIYLERALEERLVEALHEDAVKTETIAGRRVSQYNYRSWMTDWTLYVTQAKPDLLILATNRDYLVELLSRMDRKAKTRALPETLPEWKHLDSTSTTWAVRHFDPADAKLDPTSPLGKTDEENRFEVFKDADIVGLVYQSDSRTGTGQLIDLTKPTNALERVAPPWRDRDEDFVKKPAIRLIEPGVVEISSPLDGEDKGEMFLLLLYCSLGHAANL